MADYSDEEIKLINDLYSAIDKVMSDLVTVQSCFQDLEAIDYDYYASAFNDYNSYCADQDYWHLDTVRYDIQQLLDKIDSSK